MEAKKDIIDDEAIVSELTERQKTTLEKVQRQLSRSSVLSIRTDDGLDSCDPTGESLSYDDAEVLRQVVQAFRHFRQDEESLERSPGDEIDGRAQLYSRLSSRDSAYDYSSGSAPAGQRSSIQTRYVNPGRFYVRLTEETKKIVNNIHDKIQSDRTKHDEEPIVRRDVDYVESSNGNYNANSNNQFELDTTSTRYQYLRDYRSRNALSQDDINVNIVVTSEKNDSKLYQPNGQVGKRDKYNSNAIFDQCTGRIVPDFELRLIPLHQLPPRERFRQAIMKVIQKNKLSRKKKKDYTKLWEARGRARWFSLIFTIIGMGAFFADCGTDLKVAGDHFAAGDNWWCGFTVLLVVGPSVLVNLVSFFWYKEDEECCDRKPGSGWKVVTVAHFLQLGLVERYWRILVKSYRMVRKRLTGTSHYKLYIAMNLDAAMLQMILAFTEDAPQLVLQLYVLVRRRLVQKLEASSFRDLWTIASILFSFISYSRAVVNYIQCLRDSKKHKGRLKWYGYVAMWFWRAFMVISRMLVLVFFATEFKLYFFLVMFLRLAFIFALILRQEVGFFPGERWKQNFIRVVIAYIQVFCFFVLEAGMTIRWAVVYYILTFIEAVVLSVLWYTNSQSYLPLHVEIAGLTAIFVCFVAGILMMVVYYKFLHPKFKRPQKHWHVKPPPKEELEVPEEENEEENEEEEEEEKVEKKEDGRKESIGRHKDSGNHIYKQFEVWV